MQGSTDCRWAIRVQYSAYDARFFIRSTLTFSSPEQLIPVPHGWSPHFVSTWRWNVSSSVLAIPCSNAACVYGILLLDPHTCGIEALENLECPNHSLADMLWSHTGLLLVMQDETPGGVFHVYNGACLVTRLPVPAAISLHLPLHSSQRQCRFSPNGRFVAIADASSTGVWLCDIDARLAPHHLDASPSSPEFRWPAEASAQQASWEPSSERLMVSSGSGDCIMLVTPADGCCRVSQLSHIARSVDWGAQGIAIVDMGTLYLYHALQTSDSPLQLLHTVHSPIGTFCNRVTSSWDGGCLAIFLHSNYGAPASATETLNLAIVRWADGAIQQQQLCVHGRASHACVAWSSDGAAALHQLAVASTHVMYRGFACAVHRVTP